jgi:hypothetical protein
VVAFNLLGEAVMKKMSILVLAGLKGLGFLRDNPGGGRVCVIIANDVWMDNTFVCKEKRGWK